LKKKFARVIGASSETSAFTAESVSAPTITQSEQDDLPFDGDPDPGTTDDTMSYFSKLAEEPNPSDPDYVHRGIANRSFVSQFTIGDNIKIVDGNLKDGMLTINMDIEIPEEDKPRTIKIN